MQSFFKSKFLEICDELQGFCQIYTDGSTSQKKIVISDSLSGLVAICNCQLETAYVQKFIINYCQLVNAGNSITLI